METFSVETNHRTQVIDVTDSVEAALPDAADGVATVCSRHTTAAIAVNEAESRLIGDLEGALEELVADDGWDHDSIDDNADSHVRAALVGASESLPVTDGSLALGTWQSVLLVECDGPRERTVTVTTAPEL